MTQMLTVFDNSKGPNGEPAVSRTFGNPGLVRVGQKLDFRSHCHAAVAAAQIVCIVWAVADANDASAHPAIGRPTLREGVVHHVVALDAERFLDDLGDAVAVAADVRA